ncbi:MAG: hypothetical protein N4A49_08310 [Marinifilaceae bacterium]|nr:hypothetical protein [Marinifilaceae bacterium]
MNLTFPSNKAKIDTKIAQRLINTVKSRHTAHQPEMVKDRKMTKHKVKSGDTAHQSQMVKDRKTSKHKVKSGDTAHQP